MLNEEYKSKLFVWRPVLAGVVSYTELCTVMTLSDLFEINAILDAKDKIEMEQYNKQMKSVK